MTILTEKNGTIFIQSLKLTKNIEQFLFIQQGNFSFGDLLKAKILIHASFGDTTFWTTPWISLLNNYKQMEIFNQSGLSRSVVRGIRHKYRIF